MDEDDPLKRGILFIWILAAAFVIAGIVFAIVTGLALFGVGFVLIGFALYIITLGRRRSY